MKNYAIYLLAFLASITFLLINPPTTAIPSMLDGSGTLTIIGSQVGANGSLLSFSPGGQVVDTAEAGLEAEATTAIAEAAANKVFFNMIE